MKLNPRELAVDALFILGVGIVAFGVGLVFLPAGIVVLGGFLIAAAVVLR